ncbi:MAG: 3-phosphoshikimate 1-carboxyvinyltransferase [Alphaproteobacteria bacterium]|nr:3-phosphoshikimate 1-carboxyvinyltransferase [Alphaproteobacteria bacterium]
MKKISNKVSKITGTLSVPADKSISHRSLLLSSIAKGTSYIHNLLEADDVINTSKALTELGVNVKKVSLGEWIVEGKQFFSTPKNILDMGNSGTGARLLLGLLCGESVKATITGDASLLSRPMKRITEPLSFNKEVQINSTEDKLPITVCGATNNFDLEYTLPVASAQLKSAILLSGIKRKSKTIIHEPIPCRDHTERMLKSMGADITITKEDNGNLITLHGGKELSSLDISIPSDISSAAFLIVAALIVPNSKITIKNVILNPYRTGILTALEMMHANIRITNKRVLSGEDVGDINVESSNLIGANMPKELAPSMIDEYPILAIAAAYAKGKTTLNGLSELKVKESNRFEAIINGLNQNGIKAVGLDNSIEIYGDDLNIPVGGSLIKTNLDHRIAMSFLIMGLNTLKPIEIDDDTAISTSFPNFCELMNSIGANIK